MTGQAIRLISHRVLTTGVARHPERTVHRRASFRPISFPVNVVLLETTTGYWLFDTGLGTHPSDLDPGLGARVYGRLVPFDRAGHGTALVQLGELGIDRAEVTRIVLSHFHADHIGGLHDFPNAELVGRTAGLDELIGSGGISGARRALFKVLLPDDARTRFSDADEFARHRLSWPGWERVSAWRLSDDDSIVAVALPGHARGHLGLLVGGPNGVFFVADAAWTSSTIRDGRRPSRITRLVHDDWAAYLETLDLLGNLWGAGPTIVACHCGEA